VSVEREVTIYGQTFRLRGDDPDRIERAAGLVDRKMKELLKSPGQGLSTQGAVLTALNIAEEWFTSRDEQDKVLTELGERVDELISLLPEK